MNEIVIGFSKPKSGFQPFSWLIRLMTWSIFSHVYIKFYSKSYDRWLIYQASGLKVNFIGDVKFEEIENIYKEFTIPISDDTKINTIKFAIDKCGEPYGIGQAFGLLIVLIAKTFGKRIKNPFYSVSSYVCSELVADILKEILNEKDELDPATVTPQDLYNFLKSKGYN